MEVRGEGLEAHRWSHICFLLRGGTYIWNSWTTLPLHCAPYRHNSLQGKPILPSSSTSDYTRKSRLLWTCFSCSFHPAEATKSLLFKSNPEQLTLRWGVIVRVCVALTAVLHQETGIVPGHADDAIRLMQQNVGQHAPMAVHHYHLSIGSTKQHLERNRKGLLGWTRKRIKWQKSNLHAKTEEQRWKGRDT